MFPFLPAILLLLLQGHSGPDRMSVGRPGDLFTTSCGRSCVVFSEEEVYAVLLAAAEDASFTDAICALLAAEPSKSTQGPDGTESCESIATWDSAPIPNDGYSRALRVRDGPAVTA